jgi:CelD/BcsL family acetyltransferase involved in cellulose biosynthesis
MRLRFLRASSQRIAFDYSLAYRKCTYLLKVGYDPAHAAYSPSNLLLSLILRDAFASDATEYDFLGDCADWKSQWSKHSRPHYWLFVFSATLKGRLLYLIKSQLVPFLKRRSLQPLRRLILRLPARA